MPLHITRRAFVAGAAATAVAAPAVAKFADPETAEQLYEYLLRMCICSDGRAAACYVVEEYGDWLPVTRAPLYNIRSLNYRIRASSGEMDEGALVDGLCSTEAEAVRLWLANFRKDAGGATHIIWRVRPIYQLIYEPVGEGPGYDFGSSAVLGGTIYSRLWFGKLERQR